jgi:hypothetical protein
MTIALLGLAGATAYLVLARSADAPGEMDRFLLDALGMLGPATGGGSAAFAQGGGVAASEKQVREALELVAARLLAGR